MEQRKTAQLGQWITNNLHYLIGGFILFTFLYITSLYHYLLFHTLAELFSICVAFTAFVIGWKSHKITQNNYFLLLGIAYIYIGGMDLIQTLAYKGMPVFPASYGANLSVEVWIVARYIEAVSLLAAPLVINRKIRADHIFTIYALSCFFLLSSIFYWDVFPDSFIEGVGLTPFKIYSEYAISLMLVISLLLLRSKRQEFNQHVWTLLVLSTIMTIASEMSFTLYIDAYGLFNLLGHYFKIISFYLIYRAIIITGIYNPYSLMSNTIKEKDQALQDEKKHVELIINTMSVGVIVLNKEGRLSHTNDASRILFKKLLGIHLKRGYNFRKDTDNVILNTIRSLHEGHEKGAVTLQPKPGFYIQISDLEMGQELEDSLSTILEIRDVSHFIEFDQLRQQFVSTVSHELRTPISVILQSLENLQLHNDRMTENLKTRLMDSLQRNANLMAELVDDLLLVTRIDAKKISLIWSHYNTFDVLNNVLIQMETRRKTRQITITVEMVNDIPLYGDPKRIGQILRILIDNAIKYSPDHSQITITGTPDYEGPYNPAHSNGVLISVEDHGRGIHKDDLQNLFKRFYRSDDVKDIPGTGLGLSIAKELVTLHKGSIHVTSEYGKGSTFSVFLPRLTPT